MISTWYQNHSFSGTFPVQPSLLYTTFIFGNFCAAFIAAPNLFSAILQASLCQFFFPILLQFFHCCTRFIQATSCQLFSYFLAFIADFLFPLLPLFLDRLLLFHQNQSCRTPSFQLLKENRLCAAQLYFRIFSHLQVLKHQFWVCVH